MPEKAQRSVVDEAAPAGLLKVPRRTYYKLLRAGLLSVPAIEALSDEELLRRNGIGPDTLGQIRAALKQWHNAGGHQSRVASARNCPTLLKHIELELIPYAPRDDRIWLGRMGADGEIRTLESLGQESGITRERARQLTERILVSMRRSPWALELGEKVSQLLAGRTSPLYLDQLAGEDAWFRGFEDRSLFLASVITQCSSAEVHTWQLDGRWIAAEVGEGEWKALRQDAFEALKEMAARRASEAEAMAKLDELAAAAEAWSLTSALKETLWQSLRFRRGPRSRRTLLAVGETLAEAMRAVLAAAEGPLPTDEFRARVCDRLGRTVSVQRLQRLIPKAGAHALGGSRYGLVEHLDFTGAERTRLVRRAERMVRSGRLGRQWHAAELAAALTATQPELAGRLDSHTMSAMLRESGKLRDLGRMMWGHPGATRRHGEGRKSVVAVFEAVLEEAGRPLKPKEIRREALKRRGLSGNFQVYSSGRLVKLAGGLWGLEGRDE